MGIKELSGGLLPAMNEAMPHRLVTVLREFLFEHAGAREVSVLLADYECASCGCCRPATVSS